MKQTFTVPQVRDLLSQLTKEEITFSRLVEMLNEQADTPESPKLSHLTMEEIALTKHPELQALLRPLVNYLIAGNYNYLIVAGKDGICSRYLRGHFDDVTGMISGFMENHTEVKTMIKYCAHE